MDNWVVGIDLGGSKVALSLIGPGDTALASRRFATETLRGPQFAVANIKLAIDAMIAETGITPRAIGVCSPGPIDHATGLMLDPPNMNGWRQVPLVRMISEATGLPTTLEHDAKAAALGEFHFGAGRAHGVRDMAYIIIGTGMGGAVILDGQLFRGRTGAAGEIGHITIDRHGEPGSSGVRGNAEQFCSGPYLARQYLKRAQASPGTPAELTGEAVVKLAGQGDARALDVMADAGDALAAAIDVMASLFDIGLFVIGGSVSKAGDLLLQPARAALHKYAFQSIASRITVEATQLHEAGAILGCAFQARELLSE